MPLERCSSRPLQPVKPRSKTRGRWPSGAMPMPVSEITRVASPSREMVAFPVRGVLQGVAQHLLNDEEQPFFVGEHPDLGPLVVQRELFPDEGSGVIPYRPADNRVQVAAAKDKVSGVAVQPQVAQHHLYILLHPLQLFFQGPAVGGVPPPGAAGAWRRWGS